MQPLPGSLAEATCHVRSPHEGAVLERTPSSFRHQPADFPPHSQHHRQPHQGAMLPATQIPPS